MALIGILRTKCFWLCLLVTFTFSLWAQYDSRSLALGGVFNAGERSATGLLMNPSSLYSANIFSLSSASAGEETHFVSGCIQMSEPEINRYSQYLCLLPLVLGPSEKASFGLGRFYLKEADQTANFWIVAQNYGWQLNQVDLSLGLSLTRFSLQEIDHENSLLDVGLGVATSWGELHLITRNLWQFSKPYQDETLDIGLKIEPLYGSTFYLSKTYDFSKGEFLSEELFPHFGFERSYREILFRGGVSEKQLTFGLGFELYNYIIDYAYYLNKNIRMNMHDWLYFEESQSLYKNGHSLSISYRF